MDPKDLVDLARRKPLLIKFGIVVLAIQATFIVAVGSLAFAQTPQQVYNSLAKSRDALLDQRRYLTGEADRLAEKINALQTQMDTVNGYIRDNDRALRDVENAMRKAQ